MRDHPEFQAMSRDTATKEPSLVPVPLEQAQREAVHPCLAVFTNRLMPVPEEDDPQPSTSGTQAATLALPTLDGFFQRGSQ